MISPAATEPFAPTRLLPYAPNEGRIAVVPGAVLVADLTNFTGLTEALYRQAGTEGGEFVSRGLNQVLAPVVESVMRHGGEVIKFSGDGLLCMFPGEGEALAAANRVAQDIATASVSGPAGEIHRFRCAIVRGPVSLARIGGYRGRHELVAGGPAVALAQQLVTTATPGTTGVAKSLPMEEAQPVLARAPASNVEAASFLPEHVRARLSENLAQWLEEFRTLTLVFSATALPADLKSLQTTARAIQVLADGQGGQLLRFSLEEHHLVAEIAFGLAIGVAATGPHEAAQCAISLTRDLPGTRAGISTGRVLLGPIGSAARRQLTTLGTAVNVAARLMHHAGPTEVLADDTTWAAAETAFQGSRCQAVLKGLGERSFWQLQQRAQPAAASHGEALFGRLTEMEAIRSALNAAELPLQPIVIRGEAGIGKSRLTRWLIDELRGRGIDICSATATPVGRDTPYAALSSVIAGLCGLQAGLDPAQRLAEVATQLLGHAERAPLLADAIGVSMPDTPATAALEGAVRADSIRAAVLGLFGERTAEGAMTLILDDAHWLDASSWTLLQRLAANVPALRLVIVTRPMPSQEPLPLQTIQAQRAVVLELEPLGADDITGVISQRLASSVGVPGALAHWLIERARGNPFFAQELAAMLMAVGKVEMTDGAFTRMPDEAELNALPPAPTIESTLEQRIECLGVEDAIALKAASVLGSSFSAEALGELMARYVQPTVRDILGRLIAAGLTVPLDAGRFGFRHRYTQEAAYRMLPGRNRRELHEQVARGIEHKYSRDNEERAGELAHHWFAADNRPKATQWLERAGMHALHSGADREAATHFSRVLSIGDGQAAGRLASWHRQHARALLGLGQVESVAREARRAFELVARPLPSTAMGWAGLSLWTALCRMARSRWHTASSTRTATSRADDLLEAARAAGLLAESAYFVNAPEMMLGSALLAVEMAERAGVAAPVSVAHGMLGVVAGMARLHGTALHHLARARELAEAAGDPMQQGVAWFYAGMYYGCVGDWHASLAAEQRALEFTEGLGAHAQSGFQLTLIATNALYTSDYAHTRAWMAIVGERAERSTNVQQQGWACNVLSVADLHQARYTECIERSERARQIFMVERDRISLIISEGVQCAALCRDQKMTPALAAADRASAVIAGARPTTWGQLEGFAGPCEVYATAALQGLLSPADARRRARSAMTGLRLFAWVFPFGRARYHWICGLFEISRGRPTAARRCLRRAIAVAQRFQMPFEEMRATELLAVQVDVRECTHLQARAKALRVQILPTLQPEVQAV